jgi:hypothetical protein
MEDRRTSGIGWEAAAFALLVAAALFLPAAAPAGARTLTRARAEHAARHAVLQHPSYRQIDARSPLQVRACWRVSPRAALCALYVTVPSPCALDPEAELCAQALWQRRWLVEVRREAGGSLAARIVRITSQPAPAAPGPA